MIGKKGKVFKIQNNNDFIRYFFTSAVGHNPSKKLEL